MNPFSSIHELSSLKKGTKILFANVPADGHFNPLTGLAVHLRNLGCDVRWYTSQHYQKKVEKLGIPFYGLKKAFDLAAHPEMEDLFPERKNHKGQLAKLRFDMINVFILRGEEYFEDIREIYNEFPFEAMFADISFGAIPFVKEKMNIPTFAVSVFPLPETSKDLAPYGMAMTPSNSFFGKIRQAFLRKLSDVMIFAKPAKVMGQILRSHGIDPGNANIFDIHIQKSTMVLQSGTPGFEYKRSDLSDNVYFTGPLLPYQKTETSQRWSHPKLKQYKKIILVTQGTVEKDINKLIVPTIEAYGGSDHLVIVTTGGSQTNELRKRYPYENVIIEDYIPFQDIMPLADVYVSNGGYGGVLLSIQHHLPMVVAGVHEGKNEINARIGYFKLGINLKTETPSAVQIKKAVEEVIMNPLYTEKVSSLKKEFSKYNPNEIVTRLLARTLSKKRMIFQGELEEMIY